MAFKMFTRREKRQHYTDVASGKVPVKKDSKYSKAEQVAYAKGQRDARNEEARIFAASKATPLEREEYKKKRAEKRIAWIKKKRGN